MKIVDARGLLCPKPLILTKKALKEVGVNEKFLVLIDNETSKQNVERFLKDNNAGSEFVQKEDLFEITVTKFAEDLPAPEVKDYCEIPQIREKSAPVGKHVYVFKNFVADDELGKMLTKGFLETIKEIEPLPEKLIFYHKGVEFVLENSPFLEEIRLLKDAGVEILICGNCVNYYDVTEKVEVGTVSNAYTILKALTDASHIIYP